MVPCPLCKSPVDWVTLKAASQLLGVSEVRVRQFIAAGRLPNATKVAPGEGINSLWRVPIADVIALKEARDGS